MTTTRILFTITAITAAFLVVEPISSFSLQRSLVPPKTSSSLFAAELLLDAAAASESMTTAAAAMGSTTASAATPTAITTFTSIGNSFETFLRTQPYWSAFMTCSFKASAADWITQQQQQLLDWNSPNDDHPTMKNNNFFAGKTTTTNAAEPDAATLDVPRNLAFLVYGGLYQGCAQQFLFNDLFPAWFGPGTELGTVALEVLTDMLVFGPLVCLPVAYLVQEVFASAGQQQQEENNQNNNDNNENAALRILQNSWDKYSADVTERSLLWRYWGLWFPIKIVTFTIVPVHWRIPFIAAVSFFWMMILSSVTSSTTSASAPNATASPNAPSLAQQRSS